MKKAKKDFILPYTLCGFEGQSQYISLLQGSSNSELMT
uniref:Uncharacterized protein n=1 Tax=Anguilla anguilla TaxID=7936 RepID=A0A0E9PTM2_ANGAN